MANIMNQVNVKNHVHRNGFDLSFRNSFTAKVGELLPVMCKEVIPGDKFKIDLAAFTRTQPVNTAAFTRIREYYDFYFVPTELLWDKFPSYIIQTNDWQHAQDFTGRPTIPDYHPYFSYHALMEYLGSLRTFSSNDDKHAYDTNEVGLPFYQTTVKLLEYLGYGDISGNMSNYMGDSSLTDVPNIALNPFPLLAYQKIYQDYFRYSQWEPSRPYTCNLDYMFGDDGMDLDPYLRQAGNLMSTDKHKIPDMFDLRYANYKKDLFMGVLPSPQFGDTAIAAPLQGTITGSYSITNESGNYPGYSNDVSWGSNGKLRGGTDSNILNYGNINISSSTDSTAGLSVFALRFAEMSQKWKEITMSGSLDYREQIQKHWNVTPSLDSSFRSRYLGGTSSNININEVVNTNLSSSTDKADLAGKGVGSINENNVVNFSTDKYGYLMCIYHAVPVLDWENYGVSRLNTKISATDYAIPEFDNLGMEPVRFSELSFRSNRGVSSNPSLTGYYSRSVGYAPRYYDYKQSIDVVNGAFLTSLRNWVSPISFSQIYKLIYSSDHGGKPVDGLPDRADYLYYEMCYIFFKVRPDVLDGLFAVNANGHVDTDYLLISSFFDIKAVRNLSVNGLPY